MFYHPLCNSNKRQNGSAKTSDTSAQLATRKKKKERCRGVARKYYGSPPYDVTWLVNLLQPEFHI